MFDQYLKPGMVFDDSEAAFDAAGVDMSPEATESDEMSMEDMLFEHFLDELVTMKQNSKAYQDKIYQENTAGLQEADRLRRRMGG